MTRSKYLTGDKEAIKEFIDRFDVSTGIFSLTQCKNAMSKKDISLRYCSKTFFGHRINNFCFFYIVLNFLND